MSWISELRAFFSRPFHQPAGSDQLEPAEIEELLDDIEGGETNLLRFGATQKPLKVTFKMWQNSNPSEDNPETLTLYWNGQEVDSKSWTATVPEGDLFIMAPERFMQSDGEHTLNYSVQLYNGNVSPSEPLAIHIDRTPPVLADDSSLLFDEAVIEGGVTDAYLQANGDTLPATVPAYDDIRAGDILTWYWSEAPNGQDLVASWTLSLQDTTQPLRVEFPGEFIRNSGVGVRYAFYTVQDRTGTPAQRSLPMPLRSDPTPLPTKFSAPYLKETGSTGSSSTLDPARAVNGGTFVIKAGNSFEPEDKVVAYWARPGEHGAYSAPVTVAPGAIECPIPKAYIAARMASELQLYYEVTRRGKVHPSDLHSLKVEAPKNLPHPQCDKAGGLGGSQLNLTTMGTATFTVGGWPLRDTSQFVRLYITGKRNDNGKDPVVVTEAIAVPSATGTMQIGTITAGPLEVFVVPSGIEIEAFFSVDNQLSWIAFPHVPLQLVR